MVIRWECNQCGWTVWSASREKTVHESKSHLVDHCREQIVQTDSWILWNCPYCEQKAHGRDLSQACEECAEHLFSHSQSSMESGVHVAEEIDGTGSVLVLSGPESTGATNARKHFLSPADVMVFVTARPTRRLQFVRDELGELLSNTVVVTSQGQPVEDLSGVDPSSLTVEVIGSGEMSDLSAFGVTISRVIDGSVPAGAWISFEFDILPDLLSTFSLQQVFQFLHILTASLEREDALLHVYIDPGNHSQSNINILTQIFDLCLTAEKDVFVSGSEAGH